ncbi:MAG: DNA repair protein RadC [Desulfobacteraceae bacterium]|nr:MAG: DNA repair protein RadC [Desulfobacteraceae bacterium]
MRFRILVPKFKYLEVKEPPCPPFKKFTFPTDVYESFRFLKDEPKEHFITLHLNGSNKLVCIDIVSVGLANRSLVHPREVFQSALLSSACALILLHNHPSGEIQPSQDDFAVTRQLKEAGLVMGIKILDHVIIGEGYYSFNENGHL